MEFVTVRTTTQEDGLVIDAEIFANSIREKITVRGWIYTVPTEHNISYYFNVYDSNGDNILSRNKEYIGVYIDFAVLEFGATPNLKKNPTKFYNI